MNRINKYFFLLLLPLVWGLSACSDDNEIWDDEDFKCEKYVGEDYSEVVSINDFIDRLIKDYGVTEEMLAPHKKELNMIKMMNVKCNVHAIRYNTVDPNGNPVVASGIIYYPLNTESKGVVEIVPINRSKIDCGTLYYYAPEALGVVLGYACIMPDLIGCGSTENLPIAYLQHENCAQVCADMRKAAEEYIYLKYHHEISKETYIFGYSLGGPGAMMLDRLYTQHPELGVKVKSVFSGGGAYEPLLVIEQQLSASRCDYAITPNILWSINQYENLNLNFEDIFVGELKQNYKEWCNGYMPIAELTGRLGTDINGYISKTFANEVLNGTKYKYLLDAIKSKNVPLDWIPESKVYLYHANDDYYVATACSDKLNKYLVSKGVDVQYKKVDEHHIMVGATMAIDFMMMLMNE